MSSIKLNMMITSHFGIKICYPKIEFLKNSRVVIWASHKIAVNCSLELFIIFFSAMLESEQRQITLSCQWITEIKTETTLPKPQRKVWKIRWNAVPLEARLNWLLKNIKYNNRASDLKFIRIARILCSYLRLHYCSWNSFCT